MMTKWTSLVVLFLWCGVSWAEPIGEREEMDQKTIAYGRSADAFEGTVTKGRVIEEVPSSHLFYNRQIPEQQAPASVPLADLMARQRKADANQDGDVNLFDLVLVAREFGQEVAKNPNAKFSDVNGDGVVNLFDLVTVGSQFGNTQEKILKDYLALNLTTIKDYLDSYKDSTDPNDPELSKSYERYDHLRSEVANLGPEILPALQAILNDPHQDIDPQKFSLDVMGKIILEADRQGDKNTLTQIISILTPHLQTKDPNPLLLGDVLRTIKTIRNLPETVKSLVRQIAMDPSRDEDSRLDAFWVLSYEDFITEDLITIDRCID